MPPEILVLFTAPIAALLVVFFGMRGARAGLAHIPPLISCAFVTAAAFALAARVYGGWTFDADLLSWMAAGRWQVSFGVRLDGLSCAVLAMVSLVGGLIHAYAAGYMKGDAGYWRFFLVFHLFYLSMIGLLVSNNYVQLYLFWEGVGACSYLLIGFWAHKASARAAALQAFLTNRLGDAGLMLAMLLILAQFGRAGFVEVFAGAGALEPALLAAIGALLVWAASAKSAQFPLYFWLPDAMEGPTPTSALMHAATMVTAGIFLLARSWPLIAAVPGLPQVIAGVGAGTALFAAVLAFLQTDIKRILAYSTVSHLGLMAFALGLGHVGVAVLHLIMHGFFKAALFLCAGNVAHGLHQSTASVADVGGLRPKMPLTFACFALAAASLAGLFPFAGFFSKDQIVDAALHAGPAAGAAALAIAFGSAAYITRMLLLVFFGDRPQQKKPGVHEAGPAMGAPLAFLALGSLAAGWLTAGWGRLMASGSLAPAETFALAPFSWSAAIAGTAAVLLGALFAYAMTFSERSWEWSWRKRHPAFAGLAAMDMGWRHVVAGVARAARSAAGLVGGAWDKQAWDGCIEGSGRVAGRLSEAGSSLATGSLNDYLWWMATGAAMLLAAALL